MPDGAQALLDAAHNGEGAWHSLLSGAMAPERPTLVIGMMRDKHVSDIVDPLLPAISSIIATAADTPRALAARELAMRIAARGASNMPPNQIRRWSNTTS